MMNVIGFRGFARGGGGGGPIRGGMFGVGHSRKPYDKPLYAVQQPSSSGPIGAKDFATYPEPLIGKAILAHQDKHYSSYSCFA